MMAPGNVAVVAPALTRFDFAPLFFLEIELRGMLGVRLIPGGE